MEHENLNDQQILRNGWDALVSRLGIAGAIQFLQVVSPGKGDYTAERQQNPCTESLDEILARIRFRQQQTEPASAR